MRDHNIFKYSNIKKYFFHLKKNYEVTSLADWNGGKQIILRFDIDLDIALAHKMAQILKEVGLSASFFIQTTCHFYNPLEEENKKMLREMSKEGFDIGLHFDPAIYPDVEEDKMEEKVDEEASVIQGITGKKVKSVSIHQPSIHGKYLLFKGYKNAYDPRIFGEDRYMSDSRQHIRHDPYEFVKRVKEKPIQILLHALHYSEEGYGYDKIYIKYAEKFLNEMHESMQVKISEETK